MELHLPLDKLDITPPRFLTDDSKEMFKAREAFLIQAHSDAEVARTKVQAEKEAAAKAAADFQARKNRTEVLAPPPPLTEEECILIIQTNARSRIGEATEWSEATHKRHCCWSSSACVSYFRGVENVSVATQTSEKTSKNNSTELRSDKKE